MKLPLVNLLLLFACGPALAGTPYASIPGVGPTTTWEFPGKVSFLNRLDRLIDFRLAEIPSVRAQTRYVRQAADGSDTGGSGDGLSPATAWRVRDMLDVRILLASQLHSGTAILFRRGDSFYARPMNVAQGIAAIAQGDYTLGAYTDPAAPSTQKPRLLGFYRPGAAAWTANTDGTLQLTSPVNAYWVRGRTSQSDPVRGYRTIPYIKQPGPALVPSTDHSFAQSLGVLTVQAGATGSQDELDSLEVAVALGAGVTVNDVDGVRLDDLVLEGWGMDTVSSVTGCFLFNGTGTRAMVVSGCEWGWGPYHTAAHINSNGSGGIITLSQCQFGFHQNRSQAEGGSGDGFVSFASTGQQESILDRCTAYGGGLQRMGVIGADQPAQGLPCYSHTGGTTPVGLALRRGCNLFNINSTRARYAGYSSGGDAIVNDLTQQRASMPSNPTSPACYRSYVINETAELDVSPSGPSWRNVEVNWRFVHQVVQQGINTSFWSAGVSTAPIGISINRDVEIHLPPAFNGYYYFSISGSTAAHLWIHQRCRVMGGGPATPANFLATESLFYILDQSRVYSSIMSNEVPGTVGAWTYEEWNPDESVGGVANTAFLGFESANWDESLNPVALVAIPAFAATDAGRQNIDPVLIGAAHPNPRGQWFVEYDITRRLRPMQPTIGPLEARPVACLADINADQVIDFFDYLDFVEAFASSSPYADFNHDSIVDFFDYLDFVDAFSRGCP